MPSERPVPARPHAGWLAVILLRGLALLPMPLLWLAGAALGEALFAAGVRRQVVLRNLARCLAPADRRALHRLARAHYRALGLALLSTGIPWWASERRLARLVRLRDRHHYDGALAAGRNVILLVPHFLGLEASLCLSRERPLVIMYQRLRNPVLDRVMRRGRSRYGAYLAERSAPLKGLVARLKGGAPFIYLPDQNPGPRRGVFAPFFGIETATHPALGRFARTADAVVIPLMCRQRPRGRGYELRFFPPLADFPTGDPRADAAAMNRVVEALVRADPAQYFWVHRRFKLRPPGEPPFYE